MNGIMKIYFDGGAQPNPGQCHVSAVIGPDCFFSKIGYGTNNYAEWVALVWAMQLALDNDFHEVIMIGDSKLIINQANGLWKINETSFLPFKAEYDRLKIQFKSFSLERVRRYDNYAGMHIERKLRG